MIIDVIAGVTLLAIFALLRYVWKNRKLPTPAAKRVALERKERIGRKRAAERNWSR